MVVVNMPTMWFTTGMYKNITTIEVAWANGICFNDKVDYESH